MRRMCAGVSGYRQIRGKFILLNKVVSIAPHEPVTTMHSNKRQSPVGSFGVRAIRNKAVEHICKLSRKFRGEAMVRLEFEDGAIDAIEEFSKQETFQFARRVDEIEDGLVHAAWGRDLRMVTTASIRKVDADAFVDACYKQRAAVAAIAYKVNLIDSLDRIGEPVKASAWDVNEAKEVVGAALDYMRVRNSHSYERAMRRIDRLTSSQADSVARFVRYRISVYEAMKIVSAVTKDKPDHLFSALMLHCKPQHTAFHMSSLSMVVREYENEIMYSRMHRCAQKLVPQGLFNFKENNSEAWGVWISGFKKIWASFNKLVQRTGMVGVILTYLFVYKVLLFINIKLNRWVFVAILALCNHAYIRLIIEEVAETLPGECGKAVSKMDEPIQSKFINEATNRGDANYSHALHYEYNLRRRREGFEPVEYDDFVQLISEPCQPHSFSYTAKLGSVAALSMLIGKRVPLYTKIVNAQKFRAGVEDLFDGGVEAFENIANFLLRSFGSKKILDFKKQQSVVKRRASEIERFCRDARGGGMSLDEQAHLKYLQLYAEANAEVSNWPRDSSEWRCASKSLDELVRLSTDYPAHFNEAKARIEPIGLMMSGPPGIGKTHLLTLMSQIIARYERPNEEFDMSRHTFQKPPGQYWEGYKGQLILCLDDVFTKQPVAGEQDGDAEMIVKLINQWPLSLNMANCALKGRFYMTAPYVLGTTNMTSSSSLSKAVVDPQAIIRRFPFWFDVTLVEGKVCEANSDPDDTWVFKLKNFNKPTSTEGTPFKFTQVMSMLFKERKRRIDFFESAKLNKNYCDKIAGLMRDDQALNAQGGVSSVARRVCCASIRVSRPIAVVAGASFAGAKVACRIIKRGAITTIEEAGTVIKAIGAKTMCYALLIVMSAVALMLIVNKFFRKNSDTDFGAKIKAQSSRDEVAELVQRNMFKIYLGDCRIGYGLAMNDMTLLMPLHFWKQSIAEGKTLKAMSSKGFIINLIKPHTECALTDQVTFRVKTQCKDLTASHVSAQPQEKRLIIVFPDRVVRAETTHEACLCNYADPYSMDSKQRIMYSHTAKLQSGDCGAIIMGATGKYGRRVYGMHTAGTEDVSVRYSGRFTAFRITPCVAQSIATFQGHTVIKKLDKPIHNGGDTKLEPTPYAGVFGVVKTAPSVKRPRDGVDPMLKAISEYKRDWDDPPPEIYSCVDAVLSEVHMAVRDYEIRPITAWEAASGVQGLPYCKGLPRSKSPGYPFIAKYADKKKMLGADGPYEQGPAWGELLNAVEELRAAYGRGERGAIFRDSLKDEPRSHAKIEACATRLISGCAVEMAVVGRMETLLYTSAVMQTRHDHGIMPGLNPYGIEARQLHDRMAYMNKQSEATAGDYKWFDKSQNPKIMEHIWNRVKDFLVQRGCDEKVLEGLGIDTIYARHLGGNCFASDTIYEINGTLPSGHWMTSILNSYYNASVLRYCWIKQKGLTQLYNFKQNVAAVYYGDDFLCAANDSNRDFGLSCLQKWVKSLGLTMTDEDGNFEGLDFKSLYDSTFLCRRLRLDGDGIAWMALDLDSVHDMFNWKKRSTDVVEHTEAITRASLMELAAHPFEVFAGHYDVIKSLANKVGVRLAELELQCVDAYAHWKIVHKGFVPIWTPDDDTVDGVSLVAQSAQQPQEKFDLTRLCIFYNYAMQNDVNSYATRYVARSSLCSALDCAGAVTLPVRVFDEMITLLSLSDNHYSQLKPSQIGLFYGFLSGVRQRCHVAGAHVSHGALTYSSS